MRAWKFVVLLYVLVAAMLLPQAKCMTQPEQVHTFARAIARTEGFYIKGTIPNRLHNPGDICTRLRHAYPGQIGTYRGYAVFKSDKWGWVALESQIQRVIDGTSTHYDQSMTMVQIAKVYAENWKYWGRTVCGILRIDPSLTFQEYFNLAPQVRTAQNDIPLWLHNSGNSVPGVLPVLAMSSQVRGESGWLVVPMPEWALEEARR